MQHAVHFYRLPPLKEVRANVPPSYVGMCRMGSMRRMQNLQAMWNMLDEKPCAVDAAHAVVCAVHAACATFIAKRGTVFSLYPVALGTYLAHVSLALTSNVTWS